MQEELSPTAVDAALDGTLKEVLVRRPAPERCASVGLVVCRLNEPCVKPNKGIVTQVNIEVLQQAMRQAWGVGK